MKKEIKEIYKSMKAENYIENSSESIHCYELEDWKGDDKTIPLEREKNKEKNNEKLL